METWLNPSKRDSLERDYEELGKRRFEQSVPLHESVRVLLLIRSQAIEYVIQQGFDQSSLEIHAERELEHWLASFSTSWSTIWSKATKPHFGSCRRFL